MMRNVIGFVLLWAGLIIQSTVFQITPINVIQPNFVLVILILVGMTRGARPALVLGILTGFIQDVNFGSFVGLNAFIYGVVGYFAATLFWQFLNRNVAITFLITLGFTFAEEWVTYGMTRMFGVTSSSWRMVMAHSFFQMIINGILVVILYPLVVKLLTAKSKGRYGQPERADA